MQVRRILALVAAALAVALAAVPFAGAAEQDPQLRFSANMPGRITFAANQSLSCATADPRCAEARAGAVLNNNAFAGEYVDVDASARTFSSSSANLRIPLGSIVRFAGLYWGGDAGEAVGDAPVLLRTPGGADYVEIAPDRSWSTSPRHYAAFADVTDIVEAGGTGSYTIGNVRGNVGRTDAYAGWSLVVAYTDATQAIRNQTVFDGYVPVRFGSTGGRQATIPVRGFLTPLTGTVRTRMGVVAFEGDRGAYGDTITLDGRSVSDAANPANNVLNSTISTNNVPQTTRVPAHDNLLGFDADLFQLDGFLPNGAREATIVASTTNDNYYLTMVTLATDVYAPTLAIAKTVVDVDGGDVERGDVLRYAVSVRNTGADAALATEVLDDLPANVELIAGSAVASGGAVAATARRVTAYLGDGAGAGRAGTLAVGAEASFAFSVRVGRDAPASTEIRNLAVGEAVGATLGEPVEFTSNTVVSVVGGDSFSIGGAGDPDEEELAGSGGEATSAQLALALAEPARALRRGQRADIRVRVRNRGPASATSVLACATIPRGLVVVRRGGGVVEGNRICWTRAVLPAGSSLSTSFAVRASSSAQAGRVRISASATSANAATRRARADVRVLGSPGRVEPVTG
jgi:uncharacterized repeat protein (TIGR01451 family)